MLHQHPMSTRDVMFVVGNKFDSFASNEGAVTVKQLLKDMKTGNIKNYSKDTVFLPGQGLQESDIECVMQQAELTECDLVFDLHLRKEQPRRASAVYTHKHKPENSIISVPRRTISPERFELDLLVDERSELMCDHQTGQHVQGMVLIEAARQTFLAVTERFFIDAKAGINYYFVINHMNTEYINFVFPIPVTINYILLDKKTDNPHRLSFRAMIEFHQAGQVCARVETKFTAFESEKIVQKEASLAQKAIKWFHSRHGHHVIGQHSHHGQENRAAA
ncbi:AfsA domain-containing protein [Azospirillaceae bacterium]